MATFHDAFCLAIKDISNKIFSPTLGGFAILFLAMVFLSANPSLVAPTFAPEVLKYLSPIALGVLYTVIVGDSLLRPERSSKMIEVLLTMKISPVSIIIGKSLKPAIYGVLLAVLSMIALELGAAYFAAPLIRLELTPVYFLVVALSTFSAAAILTGVSIVQENSTVAAFITYGFVLIPLIITAQAGYLLFGNSFGFDIALSAVFLILLLLAVSIARLLFRSGSRYRLT